MTDTAPAGELLPLRALLRRLWASRTALLELFVGVLVPLILFATLASGVVRHWQPWWDDAILTSIHARATPQLDRVMLVITNLGLREGLVPFSIAFALWLLFRRRLGAALFFVLSMSGAGLLNTLTKQIFGRARPALWRGPLHPTDFSFPSGHAMGSMALAASLSVLAWPTRLRWPVLLGGAIFTVLVSGSRLYLGVHYPTDVLAAWAASLAWVLGLRVVLGRSGARPSAAPASSEPAP